MNGLHLQRGLIRGTYFEAAPYLLWTHRLILLTKSKLAIKIRLFTYKLPLSEIQNLNYGK